MYKYLGKIQYQLSFLFQLEYFAHMFKDPAVSQYLVPKKVLQKFFAAYMKREPINYDGIFED